MNTTIVETRRGGLFPGICFVSDIEEAVEGVLFKQLLRERMRGTPNEVEGAV
jgi:hypothetical protein